MRHASKTLGYHFFVQKNVNYYYKYGNRFFKNKVFDQITISINTKLTKDISVNLNSIISRLRSLDSLYIAF